MSAGRKSGLALTRLDCYLLVSYHARIRYRDRLGYEHDGIVIGDAYGHWNGKFSYTLTLRIPMPFPSPPAPWRRSWRSSTGTFPMRSAPMLRSGRGNGSSKCTFQAARSLGACLKSRY